MKTIEFFKVEIPKLVSEMEGVQLQINKETNKKVLPKLRREKKSIQKRIEFLKFCRNYIETEPKEEFVQAESKRLTNRINMFMENYSLPKSAENWLSKDRAAHKKAFEKEMGIPKIRTQLTTINFLLN